MWHLLTICYLLKFTLSEFIVNSHLPVLPQGLLTVQFRVKSNTKTDPGHFSDRDFFTTPVVARFFSLLAVINIDRLFVCLDIAFHSYIHIALFVQAAIAPALHFRLLLYYFFFSHPKRIAPNLQAALQSPQEMHSWSPTFLISILQVRRQALQCTHLLSSNLTESSAILLKRP